MYLGSDAIAVSPFTTRVMFLEEGDIAVLSHSKVKVLDANGMVAERQVHIFAGGAAAVEKGNHRHFMQKEIFEQPKALANTFRGRIDTREGKVVLGGLATYAKELTKAKRIILLGQGTALHASMIGEYLMEDIAKVCAVAEYASEFRYRNPIIEENTVAIAVSRLIVALAKAYNVPGSEATIVHDAPVLLVVLLTTM